MKLSGYMGAACCALVLFTAARPSAASGIPTFDAAAIAQSVQQIAVLKDQLDSARRQLESLTGTRNLGELLNNPSIRARLPNDVNQVLTDLQGVSSALASSVNSIVGTTNAPVTNLATERRALQERYQRLNATAKALGEQSYKMITERTREIDGLQAQINLATDAKAIADLQARLSVAQTNLLADKQRAELALQQVESEKALLQDRAAVIYQSWFDPSLTRGETGP